MAWKQIRGFNPAAGGTKKYYCLQNVRLGYGIGAKYPYASADWDNNIQHRDRNFPAGVAVPVYFNWVGTLSGERRNWGHIAVRLPDGRIWTDGKYYGSVDALSANYLSGSSYVGWGEMVNNIRVVQYELNQPSGGEDMIKDGDQDILTEFAYRVKGWKPGSANPTNELNAWKGHDFRKFLREGFAEGQWYEDLVAKQQDFYNKWVSKVDELGARPTKAQLEQVVADLAKERKAVEAAEVKLAEEKAKAEELAKQLEEAENKPNEDTKLLDGLFSAIKGLIERFRR